MEDLKDIINEIVGYKKIPGLENLSADEILRSGTAIFNTRFINQSKASQPKGKPYPYKGPATENQRKFLQARGKWKDGMTKQEASVLIDELKR